MATLLTDKQNQGQNLSCSWSFQQVGQNLVAQQAPVNKKEIRDIGSWTNAFLIYMGIVMQKHPNRAQELLKYMETIRTYAQGFNNRVWLGYDVKFRKRQERAPNRLWATIDMEAYAKMLMQSNGITLGQVPVRASGLESTHQVGSSQPHRRSFVPCFAFNRGEGKKTAGACNYNHVCQSC